MNEEYDKKVEIDNSQDNGNIKPRDGDLGKYVGMPITNTDNQGIREWYVANVSNIPNLIDNSQPIEIQARKAYELRNQYKRDARSAMSDKETVRILEKRRPVPTFEQLLEHKIKDKGLSREEALEDILRTASKTNEDVNKEFGL